MLETAGPGEALPLLHELLVAARLWSVGSALDVEAVARVRSQALLANHRRYVAEIPAYASLAAERGLTDGAGLEDIRSALLITDDWFKSYDPDWLKSDLPALTRWVETVSTLHTTALTISAVDIEAWRTELRQSGVFLTFSSGTSGHPSVVPRDELTLAALRRSSGVRLPWAPSAGDYDCLLLTPAGMGLGIQSGAAGLAADAHRVHRSEPSAKNASVAFLQEAAAAGRKVLVYGSPSGLVQLVDELTEAAAAIRVPAGSCVLTGGGWKAGLRHDLAPLFDRACGLLGIGGQWCVDTYAAAEFNTVFASCAEGRYHVPPVVEAVVLDELLQPVDDPAPDGRLAVLDPFALSYPGFVATSDNVRLRHDPCHCGLPGQTLLAPIERLPGASARGCGAAEFAVPR